MTIATINETTEQKLARLEAENASLKNTAAAKITLKVSDKGAVSLYGVGRFPVTLYEGQWSAVLEQKEAILSFIAANFSKLSHK